MLLFADNNKQKQIKIKNASTIEIIKAFQLLLNNSLILNATNLQQFKKILEGIQLIDFGTIDPAILKADYNPSRILGPCHFADRLAFSLIATDELPLLVEKNNHPALHSLHREIPAIRTELQFVYLAELLQFPHDIAVRDRVHGRTGIRETHYHELVVGREL